MNRVADVAAAFTSVGDRIRPSMPGHAALPPRCRLAFGHPCQHPPTFALLPTRITLRNTKLILDSNLRERDHDASMPAERVRPQIALVLRWCDSEMRALCC